MKKKPRFFCDYCGAEVAADKKRCPECGRYFQFVRCPKCGFSGEETAFFNGCPACGYSSRNKLSKNRARRSGGGQNNRPETWLYVIAAGLLALLFSIIFVNFR